MKTFKKDKLEVYISDTRAQMGKAAAEQCAQYMNALFAEKEEINVVFAAAPSQNEFLEELLKLNVDFSRINAYHMDEYVGLKPTDKQSFANFLTEHIFGKAPFKSVHVIDTSVGAEKACAMYAALLTQNKIDLVCMGIGENGHIAFNDPPVADFADKEVIKKVQLDEICRNQQVNDKCFETLNDVPRYALTLTIPTLMSAKYIVCTVPASTKAAAVKHTLTDEITTACPATILRTHDHAAMFLDADSAALIND